VRLRHLALTWFRGAAQTIVLEPTGKSMLVYGPNGAGKSSFVDGVEYLVTRGKVGHLANEYSGRRLEKAIINTQIPVGTQAAVELKLADNRVVSGSVNPNGAVTFAGIDALVGWQRERVILRQDEVSAFVQADKSEKYSSILPLIGLGPLELVATNVRGLARRVASEPGVQRDRGALGELEAKWKEAGVTTAEAGALIKALHSRYLPGIELPTTLDLTVAALRPVIDSRVRSASTETRQHLLLANARDADIGKRLDTVIAASEVTTRLVEPLLSERLAVLNTSEAFVRSVESVTSVTCPSCGQEVETVAFRRHVEAEKKRLEGALAAFEARSKALAALLDSLQTACGALRSDDLRDWKAAPAQDAVRDHLDVLLALDLRHLRLHPDQLELDLLHKTVPPVIEHVRQATATLPPEAKDLLAASKLLDAAAAHPRIKQLRSRLKRVDALVAFLAELEIQVRDEIRLRTESVISGISIHIRRMWNHLHPASRVDAIRLYQPPDASKAIDIELSFYGSTQPSPRLSLSEGDRHSLGLCVFLSLAKEGGDDRPLVLDDIVTSLDREHRSNVADLLVTEFSDRQVLLFTHEYEWFIELTHRLPGKAWQFKTLLAFDTPATGIRWSGAPDGFANAKLLLDVDPKSAANSARSLMDLHMALIAERLGLPVPFLRGTKNDLRHALDLLERFASRSKTHLQRQATADQYAFWDGPTIAAAELTALLVP
jgi:RecF/RecN/SMC N terminal domain